LDNCEADTRARIPGDFLAVDFPDKITVIRRLRERDPTMDEVCRDYEEIAALKHRAIEKSSDVSSPDLRNLIDTLAGLRNEILAIVLPNKTRRETK